MNNLSIELFIVTIVMEVFWYDNYNETHKNQQL